MMWIKIRFYFELKYLLDDDLCKHTRHHNLLNNTHPILKIFILHFSRNIPAVKCEPKPTLLRDDCKLKIIEDDVRYQIPRAHNQLLSEMFTVFVNNLLELTWVWRDERGRSDGKMNEKKLRYVCVCYFVFKLE